MGLSEFLTDGKQDSAKDLPLKPLWKCLLAEFFGTLMLIYIGCGAGLKIEADYDRPLPGIALCWAFTIATLGQTFHNYDLSMNPAITLAMLTVQRQFNVTAIATAAIKIVVQCVGCTCGAYLLKVTLNDGILGNFSITHIPDELGPYRGLVIEIVITAYLVFNICGVGDPERVDLTGSRPLSIGLCIGGIILFAAPFTGASMNPARTLGPAIVENDFGDHWVFWVGPIVGAQIGAHLYGLLFSVKWPAEHYLKPHSAAV